MPLWSGIFPAVTTQFADDESLDIPATMAHVGHLRRSGIHGVIMLGTVGENCSLEAEEKIDLLAATANSLGGALPLLAGVAETTTRGACRFAERAKAAGASGLMVLPAMVYRSSPPEVVHHIRAVADASGLPIMVYNNPVSYGTDLRPECFAAFVDDARIVAIKESSDDPRRITDLRSRYGDRFALFCGVDNLVLESYLAGIDGWVSGLVDAFPAENALLWDLLQAGAWDEARTLYRWYAPLLHLDTLPTLVQCIKLAMAEVGLGRERCRAPRLPLAGEERTKVLEVIRTALRTRPDLGALRRAARLAP